ncbi:uroporphyrinogen decarboxylase family protein [Xinfangfangia sp. CPCC 101601]|uniref:Uroporphyrinogen decarboxylase family protein n=1 Tax=Pseudogemmobacter lacusdianii TaxID=3069608 RepID=A0ABU0VTQ1_9RHOB|nr:uroporphyrinogen decarboxylase family protein [Xinfangfangia sp. CPCC 101601]MDQ2065116.1 uroporphyrinogen decarboxylase family protein [Xinfangfangia sp. CPCC 101601]
MSLKKERIQALLAGERVTAPVASFFQHKHAAEQDPVSLAARLVEFNRAGNWDFIKVQSRATYYGEAWGCAHVYDDVQGPVMTDHVVKSREDYLRLAELDPATGPLGDHVAAARLLKAEVGADTPCVHTIFSPLTVLTRLRGAQRKTAGETDRLKADMQEMPEAVRHGLEVVTRSLEAYARALVRAGGDGVFITTTAWDADQLTPDQYRDWAAPYERRVFEAAIAEGAWLNIIHACRAHTHLQIAAEQPVQIISYDSTSGRNPALGEAAQLTDKVLWSGLSVSAFAARDEAELAREAEAAWQATGGRRLVLGPTCAVPADVEAPVLARLAEKIRGLG